MKSKLLGGLLVAIIALTSVAQAQTHTTVINARQKYQENRIHRGVRSGNLTRNEARTLQHSERRLQNEKLAARADGHVSHSERNHLRREENRLSRAIYNKKHNSRNRY